MRGLVLIVGGLLCAVQSAAAQTPLPPAPPVQIVQAPAIPAPPPIQYYPTPAYAPAAAVALVPLPAVTGPGPWYVEGSAGAIMRMNVSGSTTFSNSLGDTAPGTNTATFSPGYDFNFGVGYKLPWNVRLEFEGGYAHYGIDTISPYSASPLFAGLQGQQLSLQSGGAIDQVSATFNAFYDLPVSHWLTPYVGGGVGVNYINAETAHFTGTANIPGIGTVPVNFTRNGGNAANAMAFAEFGIAFATDERWAVVPSYRFQYVFADNSTARNEDNILKLGLRYAL